MKHQAIVSVICVSILSACSSEPSDADILSALQKVVAEHNKSLDATKKTGGDMNPLGSMMDMMKIEYKSARKIGCKADGEKAYRCDVEVEASMGGKTSKDTGPVRMVKGSDGWVATK